MHKRPPCDRCAQLGLDPFNTGLNDIFSFEIECLDRPVIVDEVDDRALCTEQFSLSTGDNLRLLFGRYVVLELREWIITGYRFLQVRVLLKVPTRSCESSRVLE